MTQLEVWMFGVSIFSAQCWETLTVKSLAKNSAGEGTEVAGFHVININRTIAMIMAGTLTVVFVMLACMKRW
jgi:hypothetical protein